MDDIAKTKDAENALRESEARYRSLTELSYDWYWEQDEELRFTKFDGKGAASLAGFLGKRRWEAAGVDDSAPHWVAHIEKLRRRERFRDFEYSLRAVHGSIVHFRTSGYPVFDSSGRFTGYRGVALDVTAQRRGEEELRRFRAALDASADMMFLVDVRDSRYLDFNETACRLLRYSRAELLELTSDRVRIDRPLQQLLGDYKRLVANSGMSDIGTGAYRRKDGSTFPVEITRRVLETGDGAVLVANVRDLTERRRAEMRQLAHLRYQENIARFGQAALAKREPAELIEEAIRHLVRVQLINAN